MTRFLKSIIAFPIGIRAETPTDKLERITRERRESYEVRRFRERRQAALKHQPKLILVRSQIVGGC